VLVQNITKQTFLIFTQPVVRVWFDNWWTR